MAEPTVAQSAALQRGLVGLIITLVVMGLVLFLPAGTLHWRLGWTFWIAFAGACLLMTGVLWRLNPEIFVARSRVQPGTKALDYLFSTS